MDAPRRTLLELSWQNLALILASAEDARRARGYESLGETTRVLAAFGHRARTVSMVRDIYPAPVGTVSLCAADFDRDGKLDLALTSFDLNRVDVLLQDLQAGSAP